MPSMPFDDPYVAYGRSILADGRLAAIAAEAGCPPDWYEGPWHDDTGDFHGGPPPCLHTLAVLIVLEFAVPVPDED